MKLLDPDTYLPLIELAYKEDMGSGDITSQATIPSDQQGSGQVVFRAEGIVCGIGIAQAVLRYYDKSLVIEKQFSDGMQVSSGHAVAAVEGSLRSILAAERVVLNFLQRLSAIATMTAQYVKAVQGTEARICDTRKTTPGWRELEKYAVRCGGGYNHRHGLYDAVLIKDNHIAAMSGNDFSSGLVRAVQLLRDRKPQPQFIQVEVDNLQQLKIVLQVEGVDMVLLDNMTPDQLGRAVSLRNDLTEPVKVLLEASGNITLGNVRTIAETGVDRISIGALTHTVKNLDIGLDL